jgi:hypothetical protein
MIADIKTCPLIKRERYLSEIKTHTISILALTAFMLLSVCFTKIPFEGYLLATTFLLGPRLFKAALAIRNYLKL